MSTVLIRQANLSDHTAIMFLLDMMYREAVLPPDPVDWFKVSHTITSVMQNGLLLVAEVDGRIVGSIAGVPSESWYSRTNTIGDLWFFVESEARKTGAALKLLREFKNAGQSVGLKVVVGHILGMDPERMDALYERVGFTRQGTLFAANPDVSEKPEPAKSE